MLDRNWIKNQFQSFLNYISELFIRVYTIMPEDNVLLALPNGTRFKTLGYYDSFDGFGGTYMVRDNYLYGAKKIDKGNGSFRYLILCNGGNADEIDVCRYGIRPTRQAIGSETNVNYAISNSSIMASFFDGTFTVRNGMILKFPSGRFFFKDTINLRTRDCHIQGTMSPRPKLDIQATGGYGNGTVLVFPYLANGEVALELGNSTVSDLTVFGNPETYSFVVNRDGALATTTGVTSGEISASDVITETIKQENGSDIQCIGIHSEGANVIKNVCVAHFYEGMWFKTANTYIDNIQCNQCHTGLSIGNDTKCRGIYGWGVHTLLEVRGSISSACQVRVDSCVNVVHLLGGSKINLTDIDGDWCTDSVILVGDSAHTNSIENCVIVGLHGRCSMLSGGFDRRNAKTDIREVSDTTKYGLIRVANGCGFRFNYVVMDSIGGSTYIDGAQYMRTPTVALTFESGSNGKLKGNHFLIRSSKDAVDGTLLYTYNTAEDIRKAFMLGSNNSMRIDTEETTFYVNGTNIRSVVDSLNEVASSMDGFETLVLASTDFADLQSRLQN